MSPTHTNVRHFIIVVTLALLGAPAAVGAPAAPATQDRSRITTASGVRLRAEPRTDAAEVARLQLGVVVRELERSARRERVGAAEDFWYRVGTDAGAEGWVFGGLTAAFEPARRAEVYRQLAASRLANAAATFPELSDLVVFLERAVKEVKERPALAELELARLLALQRSLANIDMMQKDDEPYLSWTNARESQIVYSDPAGMWYVRAEMFWDLHAKYKDLPAGETIAWEAAQMPLPGECEGYLPCYLYALTEGEGRYLKHYPRGAHAGEALRAISEFLGNAAGEEGSETSPFTVEAEDREELDKGLSTLRAQIGPTNHPLRARVLDQLEAIAKRYKEQKAVNRKP